MAGAPDVKLLLTPSWLSSDTSHTQLLGPVPPTSAPRPLPQHSPLPESCPASACPLHLEPCTPPWAWHIPPGVCLDSTFSRKSSLMAPRPGRVPRAMTPLRGGGPGRRLGSLQETVSIQPCPGAQPPTLAKPLPRDGGRRRRQEAWALRASPRLRQRVFSLSSCRCLKLLGTQAQALQLGGSRLRAEQAQGSAHRPQCRWIGSGQRSRPGTSLSLSPRFTWLSLDEASLEKLPLELSTDSGLVLEWQDSETEPVVISGPSP